MTEVSKSENGTIIAVNTNEVLTTIDGRAMRENVGTAQNPQWEDVTVGKIFRAALTQDLPREESTGDEKFKRYQLATKIFKENPAQLSIEQAAQIKERVGKMYPVEIVGYIFSIL